MKRTHTWKWALVAGLGLLAACSKGQTANTPSEQGVAQAGKAKEPIVLTYYQLSSGYSEESFRARIGNFIEAKFPHVTMKFIPRNNDTVVPNLIASNTEIDLFSTTSYGALTDYINYGLGYDLTPLINKNKTNLNTLEPSTIEQMKQISGGKLYGLPIGNSSPYLLYLKDLFDKFGVAYPKDGMTWDELFTLATKMTRNVDGIQYYGLVMNLSQLVQSNQYSLPLIDPKTNKPTFLSLPKWGDFADNLLRFFTIPGNRPADNVLAGMENLLFTNMTAAMAVTFTAPAPTSFNGNRNWDMVRMPTLKELPGVGGQSTPTYVFLTTLSKKQEQAFEVLQYMISEEFQEKSTRVGPPYVTPLKNEKVAAQFGQEREDLKGKNVVARIPLKYADTAPIHDYSAIARDMLTKNLIEVIKGNMDRNTALRKADEETNMEIAKIAK